MPRSYDAADPLKEAFLDIETNPSIEGVKKSIEKVRTKAGVTAKELLLALQLTEERLHLLDEELGKMENRIVTQLDKLWAKLEATGRMTPEERQARKAKATVDYQEAAGKDRKILTLAVQQLRKEASDTAVSNVDTQQRWDNVKIALDEIDATGDTFNKLKNHVDNPGPTSMNDVIQAGCKAMNGGTMPEGAIAVQLEQSVRLIIDEQMTYINGRVRQFDAAAIEGLYGRQLAKEDYEYLDTRIVRNAMDHLKDLIKGAKGKARVTIWLSGDATPVEFWGNHNDLPPGLEQNMQTKKIRDVDIRSEKALLATCDQLNVGQKIQGKLDGGKAVTIEGLATSEVKVTIGGSSAVTYEADAQRTPVAPAKDAKALVDEVLSKLNYNFTAEL